MTRRAIGYFVHHQGRGHAERCVALVRALSEECPVRIFCAKPAMFTALPENATVVDIPSLFEPAGDEANSMDHVPTPSTMHCAPLGWPGIREAMGEIVSWFRAESPALMVCDVSAEVAQLARLCSVPHVCILQHGIRTDAGHTAAYQAAAGLLAPFDASLAQDDWLPEWREKTCFAGGLASSATVVDKKLARKRLGIESRKRVILCVTGSGGEGFSSAALSIGARAYPQSLWYSIGLVRSCWHATEPGNLAHHGWVDNPLDFIAAADLVISSAGNTTCQQILRAEKPWIVVPQWCYFDEQICKARALSRAGLAVHLPHLPSHTQAWAAVIEKAFHKHDAKRQRSAIRLDADAYAAGWLDSLCTSLWQTAADRAVVPTTMRGPEARCRAEFRAGWNSKLPAVAGPDISVLTIVRQRHAQLCNLIIGLNRQTRLPDELLVGVMQGEPFADLPHSNYPVRQIMIPGKDLPLAAARNAVARSANGRTLVFLDVDCIPSPQLVADYVNLIREGAGLLMGEVLYLPQHQITHEWCYAEFERVGVRHVDRAGPPAGPIEKCADYRCFWSLNFAIHRAEFTASGGFDESYTGYGGEDTDYGRQLESCGIPISWVRGARAFHQFHKHHMPPLHHIHSVVRNAERFARKWGYRTMDHWLYCFGLMNLIEDTQTGLRVLRRPTSADRMLCAQQAHQPFASTRRAMEALEARARVEHHRRHGIVDRPLVLDRKRYLYPLRDIAELPVCTRKLPIAS